MPDYEKLRELANEASTQARYFVDAIGLLRSGEVAINSTAVPLEANQINDLLVGARDILERLVDAANDATTEINLP
jgi:hypothetical protein